MGERAHQSIDGSDYEPSEHVSILCLTQHSIRQSWVNSLGMTLLEGIKTSGARLECVEEEASKRSVHEFAGVPVLRPER